MMMKASLRHGRQRNDGVLGLCWIDDGHCPPLSLLSLSLFGVLVAFSHHWRHCCCLVSSLPSLPLSLSLLLPLLLQLLPSLLSHFLPLSPSPLPPSSSPWLSLLLGSHSPHCRLASLLPLLPSLPSLLLLPLLLSLPSLPCCRQCRCPFCPCLHCPCCHHYHPCCCRRHYLCQCHRLST